MLIHELPIAQKNAQKHWKELAKYGLSANFNQDTIIGTATSYYLIRGITACRLSNDNAHRKVAIQGIDMAITPESIRLLNQTKRAGTKASSGVYEW